MGSCNIEYSKKFTKSFLKLDKATQAQIETSIKKYIMAPSSCNIVKIQGQEDLYRLRSGVYRILFKQFNDTFLIVFVDVKHRKDVYKDI